METAQVFSGLVDFGKTIFKPLRVVRKLDEKVIKLFKSDFDVESVYGYGFHFE